MIQYTIDKNKVWLELIVKGVPMNSKCVYTGTSKKDCLEWVKEKKKNEKK